MILEIVENRILRPGKPRPIRKAKVSRGIPPIPQIVLKNPDIFRQKAAFAEVTGKGDVLCIEGYFGRMFRSDPECVKEELDRYSEMYMDLCRKLDEDPSHSFHEVLSWNELYALHGLIPSIAGDEFGYTNSEDYRLCKGIEFDQYMMDSGEWVERFGEPYFYYCPYEWAYPDACYMEV